MLEPDPGTDPVGTPEIAEITEDELRGLVVGVQSRSEVAAVEFLRVWFGMGVGNGPTGATSALPGSPAAQAEPTQETIARAKQIAQSELDSDLYPEDYAAAIAHSLASAGVLRDTAGESARECSCAPLPFPEGPRPDCNVHGLPSAAFAAGERAAWDQAKNLLDRAYAQLAEMVRSPASSGTVDSPDQAPDTDLTPEGAQRRAQARQSRRQSLAGIRELVERSSFGTPGAKALRKRATGQPLTADEERAANEELASLESDLAIGGSPGSAGTAEPPAGDTGYEKAVLVRLPGDRSGVVVLQGTTVPVGMLLELLTRNPGASIPHYLAPDATPDQLRVLAQLAEDMRRRANREPDDSERLLARLDELRHQGGDQ